MNQELQKLKEKSECRKRIRDWIEKLGLAEDVVQNLLISTFNQKSDGLLNIDQLREFESMLFRIKLDRMKNKEAKSDNPSKQEIEKLFQDIDDEGIESEFVQSVKEFYEANKFVSKKQFETLSNILHDHLLDDNDDYGFYNPYR